IGEIETAMPIEDEVIRAEQLLFSAGAVENLALSRCKVDRFDPTATILSGCKSGIKPTVPLGEEKAAIIADVAAPVGPDRCSVRSASELSHHCLRPVRLNAR